MILQISYHTTTWLKSDKIKIGGNQRLSISKFFSCHFRDFFARSAETRLRYEDETLSRAISTENTKNVD
jgi:hypothetical protein